ncbi:MAG: hypothetical protein KDC12_04425 [Flavobacteriales bacterium]|nr:hypothetical protein [Flavobacteriales bacterium]
MTRLRCFVVLSLFLVGCEQETVTEPVVATAYDKYLTLREVCDVVPDSSSPEDSTLLADRYINLWLKEQVVLNYAEANLTEDQKDFQEQLDNYRKSLLTYAFENKLIMQKLDTSISDVEIQAYYEQNLDNFALKDYILRVRFCVLDSLTPVTPEFEKLIFSEDPEDIVELETWCVEAGAYLFINEEKWWYLDELLQQVPVEVYNPVSFLKKNKSLSFERDNKLFFLKIIDFELKDNVSPLSLQEGNIKNIILNQRKRELLQRMREDLFEQALNKKQIHINQL